MKAQIQKEQEQQGLQETKVIYSGRILQFAIETYLLPSGRKTAEIVHHPGAVVIIPITPSGDILLVQQWRRAAKEILLELPAGTLEPNEEPIACAARELQEETGFGAKTLQSLGGFYTAPGYCDEYLHLFLASDLYPSTIPADDDEMIDVIAISPKDAKKQILEHKMRDAKTISGILRYLCASGFLV